MHGRETPKPLPCSPRCGWPGLSIGEKLEPALECAGAAGGMGAAWGFFVTLCRNTQTVISTGVSASLPSLTQSRWSLCQMWDTLSISVNQYKNCIAP